MAVYGPYTATSRTTCSWDSERIDRGDDYWEVSSLGGYFCSRGCARAADR